MEFILLLISSVAPKLVPFVFQDDLLREGMRARVQCTVSEGDSPLKLKWMINGQSMQDAQLGVTIQEVDEFSSILTIGSVTPRHNGDYSCSASNAAGTAIHTARLFVNGNSSLTGVLCLAVLPKVIPFAFQDDQNFKGMRAHISCAVSQGDLPLTFQWFKDGQSLSSMKFAGANVVSYDGHSSSLSIDSVTSGHSGNYTCITTNEAGTASYTARLMVQGNCLVIDEISVLGHSVVP